jgi:threonyl-tRNA synthetase
LKKVPYLLVVGDKEKESEQVAVRTRKGVDLGVMSIADFTQHILLDIKSKKIQ